MVMGQQEETQYDLTLVTTYLPCVVLCVRACVLVCAVYAVRAYLDPQVVLMLVCCCVYLDAWTFRRNAFDRTCGHLCVCAIAVLVQSHRCTHTLFGSEYSSLLLWICDLVWGVLSAFDVVGAILGVRVHISLSIKILMLSALATTHTHLQCVGAYLPDMLSRTLLYFLLCAMLIFCGPMTPNFDRNAHNNNVLHVLSHLFFVHAYIVLGSILVITGMHGHLIYTKLRQTGKDPRHKTDYTPDFEAGEEPRRREVRKVDTEPLVQDHDLLMKLQQAKAASGVA